MTKFARSFVFVLVALSFVLAACGAPATEAPVAEPTEAATEAATEAPAAEPTEAPAEDPMAMYAPDAVTGDIITAGSSTVFPLSERMSELFQQEGYTGNITVDSIGSGAGFERFCKTGETDIANASRPIKDSEVEACAAIGREPIEFRVGTDALAVVVSAENDFVTGLTKEQLGKIYTGEFKTWDQVDAAYPAEAILIYSPGADSGTFDYFVEAVVAPLTPNAEGKADIALGEEAVLGLEGAQFSEDDNVLVQGVEGSPYAIGYFGFAYYSENSGALKAISIEGVEPNQASVDAGEYPLARPLFIYSDAKILTEKPQVAAFIYFYLSNVNDNIVDVGYFPAPADALQGSLDAWTSATSGEAAAPAENEAMAMYAPDAVTGDIITAGSSTVFPLSERMSELFQQEGYTGNITVDSIGSGAGFERFCKTGETDIANASRPIKDSEVEACAAIGREPIEFRVGTDALAVVVSAENDFVTGLTKEQLGKIYTGEFKTWDQVDATYPAEAILIYSPGADSGTFDYFVEAVAAPLTPNAEGKADITLGEEAVLGLEGAQFSEDDNVLVQGVEGSPYAIGYFGFAYYSENSGALKAIGIEGVEPNQASVDAGEYPLARPLFIYSDAKILTEKPQVAAFIYFYLSNVNDNIVDVGYFPAPADALQGSLDAWMSASGN
ncbi:PstS family phosphate ABC transporter substrate-binding protein [Candidatus Villigracilis affinis]|uniref:PstS family phosphate ABC transporter substrate-binding protein n=1 Tax=Candidatus Villigracilis affinis TaxID=3140682 RepID=UPI001DF2CE94|nr:PstS family phosphate ABC transporter substrate-binding protein [Anaerolineales bacterium]